VTSGSDARETATGVAMITRMEGRRLMSVAGAAAYSRPTSRLKVGDGIGTDPRRGPRDRMGREPEPRDLSRVLLPSIGTVLAGMGHRAGCI
jgi:hypothetical protein